MAEAWIIDACKTPRGISKKHKAGLTNANIDLWEINEAFAVVAEQFRQILDLNRDKVNVNGRAIALGHSIGATGSILVGTVNDELERRDGQYGLVTTCSAGFMAPAGAVNCLGLAAFLSLRLSAYPESFS